MFQNLKIQNKILFAIATILVITLVSVTMVVSIQSGRWFNEAAEEKLSIATRVILSDIQHYFEEQKKDIRAIVKDDNVISPASLIRDFIQENPTQIFEDAYAEMASSIALRLAQTGDASSGFHLMRFYDANARLIAFYKKSEQLTGWYIGAGKFSGISGGQAIANLPLPSEIDAKYPAKVPDKYDESFGIFADQIAIASHGPVVDSSNGLVGVIVVDTLLDNHYAEKMSTLSNTRINFFNGVKYGAGVLEKYQTLSNESYQSLQSLVSTGSQSENRSINRGYTVDGKDYYEALFPFVEDGNIIGAMSVLYPKEYSAEKQMNAMMLLLILSAIVFVAGIAVAMVFARTITLPIGKAVDISNRLAEGDLRVNIEVESQDETGRLLASMKNMVSHFKDIISNVRQTADTVASASHELRGNSQQMAESLSKQADKVTQVATASTEMSQSVLDIAKNVSSITSSSLETAKIAKNGENIVKKSIKEVLMIAETVRKAAQMINSVGEQSQQVGAIVNVISEVADQTNLLALNAAIEAARAGESGRGFSVVADEVKKLAERTREATSEIRGMIKNMQSGVQHAMGTMTEGTQRVEIGVDLSTQAGAALGNIVASVSTLQSMLEEISAATKGMSAVSEQTNCDIVEISTISHAAVSSFDRISQSAMNMTELSGNLQDKVGQFRIGGGDQNDNGYSLRPRHIDKKLFDVGFFL